MAQVTCALCGEPIDSDDYRVKQCSECGSWFCYRHLGQYKSQCTPCKTYTLKNCYGDLLAEGAGMIIVTGGMSVDPDDRTPASIRAAGGREVTYGSPTFPGSMFMLAYIGDIPVVGVPGCAMYNKATVFDVIVPRILAGDRLTRGDITDLGHGGLCLGCSDCRFPNCGFGT